MVVRSLVRSVIAAAALLTWAPIASAELVMVRVVGENVAVRVRPSRLAETLAVEQPDTVLEVLSKEGGWFWVLVGRDNHGTQRAGWIRESDVEFVNGAHYFLPPAPKPIADQDGAKDSEDTVEPKPEKAEKPVKVAKVEKPKKVDNRKLKKAEAELEKARQAYEKLTPRAQGEEAPFPLVGEPIVEPLYQISQN